MDAKELIAQADEIAAQLDADSDRWPATDMRFDALRVIRKLRAALPSDAAQAPRYEVSAGGKWNAVTEAQYDAWSGKKRINAAPVAPAAAPINLEGLRKKLLTPRKILRDEQGWCWHPDYPICDEGTRADKFLEALGIEPAFVDMESDLPDFAERYHEEGLTDCTEWTPTPPAGEGWLLLAIYDTEDGPCAIFGRDQYEAENAQKRQRTRELSERIKQRQADKGAAQ